jgi:hypothetical protein
MALSANRQNSFFSVARCMWAPLLGALHHISNKRSVVSVGNFQVPTVKQRIIGTKSRGIRTPNSVLLTERPRPERHPPSPDTPKPPVS